jgi:RNA polymerase sigma factor (sigma-70 family)
MNDSEMLRQYIEECSESAFTELVQGHLNLVYSAALRETNGDMGLAQDISQAVFTELARKARRLQNHPSISGWLYRSVRLVAANVRRAEHRRRHREEEAQRVMDAPSAEGSPDRIWQQIQPELDDVLHNLNEADRTAVVLRFLEERSLREVGAILGLNENAARMRVDRALDRLRGLLQRRGITSTASGLAAALAVGAVTPAPAAWAATMASTALASSATVGATTLTFLKIMSLTKIQAGVIGVLVLAGIGTPLWQETRLRQVQSDNAQLRVQAAELTTLRQEVALLKKTEADKAELEQLRKWQAQVQPELMRLRGMAGVARRANAEAAELKSQMTRQSQADQANRAPIGEVMKVALEQQVSNRLSRMTTILHLTPEQTDAARDILMKQARVTSSGMEQVFSGKFDPGQIAKLGQEAGNPEQQIKVLLTPEQQAGYKAYQEEEAAQNARLAANNELLQMQSMLGLTPQQEDQVFGVLYNLTLDQLNGKATPAFTNAAEQMQWASDQKVNALQPVLGASQLDAYRQLQETQLKFVRSIVSKMQGSDPGK